MAYGLRVGPRVLSVRVEEPPRGPVLGVAAIRPGAPVVDVDGDPAGHVAHVGERFLEVSRGFLEPSAYVPLTAICEIRGGVVRLGVPAARLAEPSWQRRPRSGL